MNIQTQLQPIADNINSIEIQLQELELIILNVLGSNKFKWNDFKDIKRKSTISECHNKVKGLIENSMEIRENIRNLSKEYLKLKFAIKSLDEFTQRISQQAQEIKNKLTSENFIEIDLKTKQIIEENKNTEMVQEYNHLVNFEYTCV